jgi:uncharacterized protein YqgV (UPF0045/DUF77 family)
MQTVVIYERKDGSRGTILEGDWLRIMQALLEATQHMYQGQITDGR